MLGGAYTLLDREVAYYSEGSLKWRDQCVDLTSLFVFPLEGWLKGRKTTRLVNTTPSVMRRTRSVNTARSVNMRRMRSVNTTRSVNTLVKHDADAISQHDDRSTDAIGPYSGAHKKY